MGRTNSMKWLTYLIPREILKTSSIYNRDIRVIMESGEFKLLVNGARESGRWVRWLWAQVFRSFHIHKDLRVKNILVLGIAGGTVIHMLSEMYPAAKITGVDIDPVMISIGKRYFGLSTVPHFTPVSTDAVTYTAKYNGRIFDLVVIDVYIGADVPDFVVSAGFHKNVRRIIGKNGRLIINYLRRPEYESRAVALKRVLSRLYDSVGSESIEHNRFFLANSL